MRAVITPCRPEGVVTAPPSKSMAHRLLIAAALSEGVSRLRNVDLSDDISATLSCVRALGSVCSSMPDGSWLVSGSGTVKAYNGIETELYCRESGSTLRFMIPLCLITGESYLLFGSQRLLQRPLDVYEEICLERGILFERHEDHIKVRGRLSPGIYRLKGNVSSQFVSGLLFALPLLDGDSRIELIPPVESRPYIDMTLKCLRDSGIDAGWDGKDCIYIKGGGRYSPVDRTVEGDFSNAAFLDAMNFTGGNVTVKGLPAVSSSQQADRVYRKLFGKIRKGWCRIDVSDCPDLAPVLFAAAALCEGALFTGTSRLRLKESDRGWAMSSELMKFGVKTECGENRIEVFPVKLSKPSVPLSGHNDHRIVMALAVLCAVTGGEIQGADAVRKSFPDFWDRMKSLGYEVEQYGLDQ